MTNANIDESLRAATAAARELDHSMKAAVHAPGRTLDQKAPNTSEPSNVSTVDNAHESFDVVLDEVVAFCKQFVAYPDGDAPLAHALWIGHAWLVDLMFTTPRLAFVSPEKRSGKTRAQEVTALLVPNPVNTINVSAAYLYRRIQEKPDGYYPTIELDETDALFTGRPSESTEQIRGIINAGYRQGATVGRAEATNSGEVKTIDFPVFAPVCLAGIGDMPDTIEDRSIIIHMKRRRPDHKLKAYRARTAQIEAEPLRTRLAACASEAHETLAGWSDKDYPALPDTIQDRDADVWEPLYIVAELAGGHWPQTVLDVSQRMVKAQHEQPQSIGERLLRDIRTVFGSASAIYRTELIDQLRDIEGAPWATLGKNGEGIDSWFLTKTLRKYDIAHDWEGKAHSIRINAMPRDWGYYRSDFTDAWARYLPEQPSSEKDVTSVTGETPASHGQPKPGDTGVTSVTDFPEGVPTTTDMKGEYEDEPLDF